MYSEIDERTVKEAEFILKENATVRKTAEVFGVGKSTVHYDMTRRLKRIDEELFGKVADVLFINLSERHIRGGMATKYKYGSGVFAKKARTCLKSASENEKKDF